MYVDLTHGGTPCIRTQPKFSAAHSYKFMTMNMNNLKLGKEQTGRRPDEIIVTNRRHAIVRGKVPTLRVITCPVVIARVAAIDAEVHDLQERINQLKRDRLDELRDGYRRGVPADVKTIQAEQAEREAAKAAAGP